MDAVKITRINGGQNTYPGGCNYSGGGSQCENPNYTQDTNDPSWWEIALGVLIGMATVGPHADW